MSNVKPNPIREARQLAFVEMFRASAISDSLAIDTDFPEEFANNLSKREAFNKHLFRPNTYLHKWWARRCGSTFRIILKQFVEDPVRRDYYAPGGLEGKIVLDPMMGGGTTLHEAIRLGASVIGADIDPIPVVQARASLTEVPFSELHSAFGQLFDTLYSKVGHLFQTECPICDHTVDSQYALHGLRKTCRCGEVLQVDRFVLRQESDRTFSLCPATLAITVEDCEVQGNNDSLAVEKDQDTCLTCGETYRELLDEPFYLRYRPFAIVGECNRHGLFIRKPGAQDVDRIEKAHKLRSRLDFGPLENFLVADGPKSGDLLRRNISSYLDVFSSRQLAYLHRAVELTQYNRQAVRLNLALLISTSLEFNSLLCGYKGWSKNRPGAIRHVFSLHAYSFPYTAAENNPLNQRKSSGNLQQLFQDRLVRGRKWAMAPVERKIGPDGETQMVTIPGEWDGGVEAHDQNELNHRGHRFWLIHGDSSDLPITRDSVDFIVTDPPYYDNVQYSDLAAFFRVWLARLLPDEINWIYDESLSAVASKVSQNGTGFLAGLSGIFRECSRVLKPGNGRMVFTFHHWDPNAWAELTIALRSAGFRLVNSHVVFSENPVSVHINNLKAISHDAILVLATGNDAAIPHWASLDTIDSEDSEMFCWQCAAATGWLLESCLDEDEIRDTWKRLIKGTA